MDKPDVDFIEGLSPAVSIDQKSTNRNPRSTVGTITEVYDYLRLLFARAGTQYCPICGERVTAQTPQQIVDRLLELPEGTRYQVLAPVVRGRKGEYADLFKELQSKGFARARVDGEVVQLTEPPDAREEAQARHRGGHRPPRLPRGRAAPAHRLRGDRARARRRPARRRAGRRRHRRPQPRAAVLRAPRVPERPRAHARRDRAAHVLVQRAVRRLPRVHRHRLAASRSTPTWWSPTRTCRSTTARSRRGRRSRSEYFARVLSALAADMGFSTSVPWRALPQRAKDAVLHGQNHEVKVRYKNRWGRERQYSTGFEGVITFLERRHNETDSDWSKEKYEAYMREVPCPVCEGARLKPEVLAVRVGGKSIAEVCTLPIREARDVPRRPRARRARARDRRAGAQGDPGAARLPARRRPRLPLADPPGGDAVRRRGAAHPARDADRLRPGRRALRPRRAEHRPAPARQPAPDRHAHAPAGPGQHAHRRRARRGHHPHGRLDRRHRPRRRRARRSRRPLGRPRRACCRRPSR